jgi:hypothetical protein
MFTLVRREIDGGGEWTLHELFPREKAEGRSDRLDQDGRSLSITAVDDLVWDVAGDDLLSKLDRWT